MSLCKVSFPVYKKYKVIKLKLPTLGEEKVMVIINLLDITETMENIQMTYYYIIHTVKKDNLI